jgi:cobyrinic acid a,c-diamide synthase
LLSERLAAHVDLTAILAIAHTANPLTADAWDPGAVVRPASGSRPVVAIAAGRAFTFRYAETDELLRAAGCEPVTFDPLTDPALPPGTAGLYLGGGFPEVHAAELSANASLRADIKGAIAAGLPTAAECAGLLYLCDTMDGAPMIGAIGATATMSDRLTLSYRQLVADHDQLLAAAGTRVTGHEFHRTVVEPATGASPGWLVDGRPVGFGHATLHASYLHVHWAGHPRLAERFADAVHAFAGSAPNR